MSISGIYAPIDHYYNSKDAWVILKTAPRIIPYFRKLLEMIELRECIDWLDMSVDRFRAGDFREKNHVARRLEQLRSDVLRNWRKWNHLYYAIMAPPRIRNAAVAFYLYPYQLFEERKRLAEELAADALEHTKRKRRIIIGRNVDRWTEPFSFWGYVEEGADA